MLKTLEPKSKPAPRLFGRHAARKMGTIPSGSAPIFIYGDVLDEILDFSQRQLEREIGGFLMGGLYEDGSAYIEIDQFLPATRTDSAFASLKFTHETWARLNKQIANEFKGQIVLGWHHTHPGFGIFLSHHDLFIHKNFFSQPWQVAMVVDPRQHELGFFCWTGTDVVNCGFVLVPGSPAR